MSSVLAFPLGYCKMLVGFQLELLLVRLVFGFVRLILPGSSTCLNSFLLDGCVSVILLGWFVVGFQLLLTVLSLVS